MYQTGESLAFDELFNRYKNRVYSYVSKKINLKTDRDDVTQNVFIKLHQTKERYQKTYAFEAWLFVIARSIVIDHLRIVLRENKNDRLKQEVIFQEQEVFNTEDLESSLATLPIESRKIIEMKYLDELSYDEIASKLDKTSANVRQILSRGLRFLRKNDKGNL